MIIKSKEINGCHVEFKTNGIQHGKLSDYGSAFTEDVEIKINILFTQLMKTVNQFQ